MKVIGNNNSELNATKKVERPLAGSNSDGPAIDGLMPGASSEKSDFANVLERVTRSHNDSLNRPTERSSNDRNESRESKTADKEKVEADVLLAGADRTLTREPLAATEAGSDA